MNPKVNFFFEKDSQWKAEYAELRRILLDSPLDEELKWGCPCYTLEKKNVVLIHGFKEYCALLFQKGVLLQDPAQILIQQTENVQSARQIRFTNLEQIFELEETIRAYVIEAWEVEKAGKKVEFKKADAFDVAEEFQAHLDADPNLKTAFENLSPGRQRGYLLYFSSAKQAKTRASRVERYIPKILDGKGMEDE